MTASVPGSSSSESLLYEGDAIDVPENVISITVNSSIATLSDEVFSQRRYLMEVNMPLGLQVIGEHAFLECSALKEIDIPSTVIAIGAGAFQDCSSLVRVTFFTKGLQLISARTFQNCYNLRKILIPHTVTAIEDEAFQYCLQLVSIELGSKNLTKIGARCFQGCESLRNIYPLQRFSSRDSLWITEDAFDSCESLFDKSNDPDEIIAILKSRFDGLDLHRLCYCQGFMNQDKLAERLDEVERNATIQEPFGMTPLHILAMSTAPNLSLCNALLKKYPNDLLAEHIWGLRPLHEACACSAPLDMIQLLVETLVQNFPDQTPDWLSLIHETDSAETIQYLVRTSLAKRISCLGLERWRNRIVNAVEELGTPPKANIMIHYNRNELTGKTRIIQQIGHIHHCLDQLQRLEILSLLELAVWEAKISGSPNLDRPTCRVQCGVEVVVNNVLPFMDTVGECLN
jgi:hypothetical protein